MTFLFFKWTPKGNVHYVETTLEHIPDVCVHVTTKDRVESILTNGLVPNSPRYSTSGEILGVYIAASKEVLCDDGMDSFNTSQQVTLLVNVATFKHLLKPDPMWRSSDHNDPAHCVDDICWYIQQTIAPAFIQVA